MAWAPEPVANIELEDDPKKLVAHYLQTINDQFRAQNDSMDRVRFTKFAAAPARPEKGAAYYADGTNWNPGNGEGIYLYNNAGVFVFLGPANLTGPITSVGGVTSVASQTGTGSTFVMQTSPTLITPNIGAALGTSLGIGVTVARSPLHMAGGSNNFALMQNTSGFGGTVLTNTDIIPIISNNGFSGYGGLATLPNRWGNATTIDAHTAVYIGGAQRNSGAACSSLVFANWGYFTGTSTAAGGLGNATDQADAVKFKFQHLDNGSAFAQTLQLVAKSASLTEVISISVASSGAVSLGGTLNLKSYTVATLPVGVQGDTAYVTNALGPAYGAAVVGGGTVIIPVFRNATTWICA